MAPAPFTLRQTLDQFMELFSGKFHTIAVVTSLSIGEMSVMAAKNRELNKNVKKESQKRESTSLPRPSSNATPPPNSGSPRPSSSSPGPNQKTPGRAAQKPAGRPSYAAMVVAPHPLAGCKGADHGQQKKSARDGGKAGASQRPKNGVEVGGSLSCGTTGYRQRGAKQLTFNRLSIECYTKVLHCVRGRVDKRNSIWKDGPRLEGGDVRAAVVWWEEGTPLWIGPVTGRAHTPGRREAGWMGRRCCPNKNKEASSF